MNTDESDIVSLLQDKPPIRVYAWQKKAVVAVGVTKASVLVKMREDQSFRALTAGSGRPMSITSIAPPPVHTWTLAGGKPTSLSAARVSPPPTSTCAFEFLMARAMAVGNPFDALPATPLGFAGKVACPRSFDRASKWLRVAAFQIALSLSSGFACGGGGLVVDFQGDGFATGIDGVVASLLDDQGGR